LRTKIFTNFSHCHQLTLIEKRERERERIEREREERERERIERERENREREVLLE